MKKKHRLLQPDSLWGLAAALLILLQFWWLPGEDGSAADSYSTTVDGKLGLYQTLAELIPNVERDPFNVVPAESATLLLIAPDRYPTETEQELLHRFVQNGGNLLFAPNWLSDGVGQSEVSIPSLGIELNYRADDPYGIRATTVASTEKSGTATPTEDSTEDPMYDATDDTDGSPSPDSNDTPPDAGNDTTTAQELPPAAKDGSSIEPISKLPDTTAPASTPVSPGTSPDEEASDADSDSDILVTSSLVSDPVSYRTTATVKVPAHLSPEVLVTSGSGSPEAVIWKLGQGQVLVCSSADLFSNRSLLYPATRRLAVRLVERCALRFDENPEASDRRVVINEYFNASDSFQNTGILFSPILRTGTLQLLLVAILGIWMAFHRFGPAVDITSVQRRSLTESAEAVGNLQYRLHDGGAVIKNYLEYMNSQLRRRYGSTLRLDQEQAIARRSGMKFSEVHTKLMEARKMAETTRVTSAEAAEMLRWLTLLQQRLTGLPQRQTDHKTRS